MIGLIISRVTIINKVITFRAHQVSFAVVILFAIIVLLTDLLKMPSQIILVNMKLFSQSDVRVTWAGTKCWYRASFLYCSTVSIFAVDVLLISIYYSADTSRGLGKIDLD